MQDGAYHRDARHALDLDNSGVQPAPIWWHDAPCRCAWRVRTCLCEAAVGYFHDVCVRQDGRSIALSWNNHALSMPHDPASIAKYGTRCRFEHGSSLQIFYFPPLHLHNLQSASPRPSLCGPRIAFERRYHNKKAAATGITKTKLGATSTKSCNMKAFMVSFNPC